MEIKRHVKFPTNSFSISKSYLRTVPTNHSNTQTIDYTPSRIYTPNVITLNHKEVLDQKLKTLINSYQTKKKKELRLKSLYNPLPSLTRNIKAKKVSTKKDALSASEIINIVSNNTSDKKIDLKMNINQYDIKYYLRSESKHDRSVSDIENNNNDDNNTVKQRGEDANKEKNENLKKKLRSLREDITNLFKTKKSKTIDQNLKKKERYELMSKQDTFTRSISIQIPMSPKLEENSNALSRKQEFSFNEDDNAKKSKEILEANTQDEDKGNCVVCPPIHGLQSPNKQKGIIKTNHRLMNYLSQKHSLHDQPMPYDQYSFNQKEAKTLIAKEKKSIQLSLPTQMKSSITKRTNRRDMTIKGFSNSNSFLSKEAFVPKLNSVTSSNNTDNTFFFNLDENQKQKQSHFKPRLRKNSNIATLSNFNDKKKTYDIKTRNKNNPHSSIFSLNKQYNTISKKGTFQSRQVIFKSIKDKVSKTKSMNVNESGCYSSFSNSMSSKSSYTQEEANRLFTKIFTNIRTAIEFNAEIDGDFSFHSKDRDDPLQKSNTRFYAALQSAIRAKVLSRIETNRSLNGKSLLQLSISSIKEHISQRKVKRRQSILLLTKLNTSINSLDMQMTMSMECGLILSIFKPKKPTKRKPNPNHFDLPFLLDITQKEFILKKYFDIYRDLNYFYMNSSSNILKRKTKAFTRLARKTTNFSLLYLGNPLIQRTFKKFDNLEYVNKMVFRDLRYHLDKEQSDIDLTAFSLNTMVSKALLNINMKRTNSIKKKLLLRKQSSFISNPVKSSLLSQFFKKKKKVIQRSSIDNGVNYENDLKESKPIQKTLLRLRRLLSDDRRITNLKREMEFHMINRMTLPSKRIGRRGNRKGAKARKRKMRTSTIRKGYSFPLRRGRSLVKGRGAVDKMISKYESDINKQIIHVIKEKNIIYLLSLLMKKERNINLQYKDSKGNSFVHWAVLANSPEICELLIERGCDYNLQNVDLNTPLHLALSRKHYGVVNVLLKFKASEEIVNKAYLTPWQAHGINIEELSA